MSSKLSQPWIPLDRVERLVQLEPMLACIGLALGAWLIYRTLLRGVSRQRHENLTRLFKNLLIHTAIMITLFSAFFAISFVEPQTAAQGAALNRLMAYVGLGTLLSGVTVFVKVCRILFFEYLFLTHMRVAVPLLLVNICTLLLSLVLGSWLLTEIFDIRLGPLLATSAVFSLVVGLALQDTLGNLFSGVALQLDEPYQIGDWIEVNSGSQKWVGLVDEISWRATVLIGWLDETITIPNRVMGQAQISNFSTKLRPIARSQAFKIAHGSSLESARRALLEAPLRVPGVRRNPSPSVIITEANESWLVFKLVYFIDDYGAQYTVADQIIAAAIHELDKAQVTLASPRIEVTTTHAA